MKLGEIPWTNPRSAYSPHYVTPVGDLQIGESISGHHTLDNDIFHF